MEVLFSGYCGLKKVNQILREGGIFFEGVSKKGKKKLPLSSVAPFLARAHQHGGPTLKVVPPSENPVCAPGRVPASAGRPHTAGEPSRAALLARTALPLI